MKTTSRIGAALGVVAAFVTASVVLTGGPASALAPAGTTLGSYTLNVDPTLIAAAADGQPAGTAAQLANGYRYDSDWESIQAHYGTTAPTSPTAADYAKIQALSAEGAQPSSRLATAGKVAGSAAEGAGAALAGVNLGATADRLLGVDVDGGLCGQSSGGFAVANSILAGLTGTNCDTWRTKAFLAGAAANADASAGTSLAPQMDDHGRTITTVSHWKDPSGSGYSAFCWTMTGPGVGPGGYADDYIGWSNTGSGDYGGSMRFRDTQGHVGDGTPICGDVLKADGSVWLAFDGGYGDHAADLTYFFVGANARTYPTTTSADPARTFRCDVTLGSGRIVTASTQAFHESDDTVPSPVCPAVPGGDWATHTKIVETGGSSEVSIWDADTTGAYQTAQKTRPECANGSCALLLMKGTKSCLAGAADCADWFDDPDKADNYSCTWGGQALPLDHCNVYAPTFRPQAQAQGRAYADPTTGQDAPAGVQTTPRLTADADTSSSTESTPCFPSGWGVLNPVEWVQRPAQCAIRWAFVPSDDAIAAEKARVNDAYRASLPGRVAAAVAAIPPLPAPTGCSGLDFDLSGWKNLTPGGLPGWSGHVAILSACEGETLHPWAVATSVMVGGLFVIGGVFAITRLVGRIVNYQGAAE